MDKLTAKTFRAMLEGGSSFLLSHKQQINDLNVFPVADGDTGNNMSDCLRGGLIELKEGEDLGDYAARVSSGMLFKARGNSGVILSQFFAGLCAGLNGLEDADILTFHDAYLLGVKRAYEVVVSPVEGTILTVMREAGEAAKEVISNFRSFESYFSKLIEEMNQSLLRTPNLLPVLKDANVVDSGGAGLLLIFQGMSNAMHNGAADIELPDIFNKPVLHEEGDAEYGYCTEFILHRDQNNHFSLSELITFLETKGNSIVAFEEEGNVKVHIHTLVPNEVLDHVAHYGQIIRFKMDDMSLQHDLVVHPGQTSEIKDLASLAIVPNKSIARIFTDYGVDEVLICNDSLTPSTGDLLMKLNQMNAKEVFVFPNNGNSILAAETSSKLVKGKKVHVIPTHDLGEGISAVGVMDEACFDSKDNRERIIAALKKNYSVQVGIAVKPFHFNDQDVDNGDYVGFNHGSPVSSSKRISDAFVNSLAADPSFLEKEVLIYLYGVSITQEIISEIEEKLHAIHPFLEIYALEGKQSLYPLIGTLD